MDDGADSNDETVVSDSMLESDREEGEELYRKSLSLPAKDMTFAEENTSKEIRNICGEKLSPEIQFICKQNCDLQIIKQTEQINVLHEETNEGEESQSLLKAKVNCTLFPGGVCQKDPPHVTILHEEYDSVLGLELQATGFLETVGRHIANYADEDTPELSLSNVNASEVSSKNSVQKDKEVEEVFESARMTGDKGMTEVIPCGETVVFDITENGTMAENLEDKLELLSDSECFQMCDLLENPNHTCSADAYVSKEDSALPVELLSALNSLSESVETSTISHPVGKGSGHSMAKKELPGDKKDNNCTHVKQANLKYQFHLQAIGETEAVTAVATSPSSKQQNDCDQHVHKFVNMECQTMILQDRLNEKRSPVLKDVTSGEQPIHTAAHVPKKSNQKRRKFTVNVLSSCQQLLEGMNKKIDSCEAKVRASAQDFRSSDTKYEKDEPLQLGSSSCRSSSSDMNNKVEQVRKSQRIAKKRKQMNSKNYSSESYNYISQSSINRRDIFGQTLLHRAAVKDDLDGIRAMIKAGANVNTQDYAGWTPLHETSAAGCFEASNELLKAGANVNCMSHERITPLHDAVKDGHYKVAELLLWYGADPLLKNERGKSALEEAPNKQMRKLLESYATRSTVHEASAEKLIEDPVGDPSQISKSQSQSKVRRRSSERVKHSSIDNARTLKHNIKLEKKKRKRSPQNNSASQSQNSCRLLNATTPKDTCSVLKAKQSVRKRASSLSNYQRTETHNDFGHAAVPFFAKEAVRSSVPHQHISHRIGEAAKEPSMFIGSEIQQESDLDRKNNDGSSERKEAYQRSEPAGTLKGQVTNPSIVTSLSAIQEECASPSLTNLVNESNLQKEEQYAMKHSNESPCHQVDILLGNLHSAEKMCVWQVREEGINRASEKTRSQYVHSENCVDKINLEYQEDTVIGHELRMPQELLPVAKESICLKDKPVEPKSTSTLLDRDTTHLSDSDCTLLSEQCDLNAEQNTDKNTSKAVETYSERTVQVNMEIFSPCAFSQHINRTGVSEHPDTFRDHELTPVNKTILLGQEAEENVTCCLERSKNDTEVESNMLLTSHMLDQEPFQGEMLSLEECYDASRKEDADNIFDVPLQSNNLQNVQSKIIQNRSHENSPNTHGFSSRNENNGSFSGSQFSQTEEHQNPDSSASSYSSKKKKKASSQLPMTITAKINKTNTKGETRLHLAARKGDLSLVKSLIASGVCVNQKDNAGWTAIHEASNRGFTEIIAELLKAGADVNSKSLDGVLPIHDAVSGNHFEAVQLLLIHGANPNETDNCGGNALSEATCDKMKDLLQSYGAAETKEIPRTSNGVGGKESHPSRSRKIHSSCDCHVQLTFHSKPAGQKCGTHESISKVLQDIGKKQDRLSLFELRSQRDADLYIQKLSQIQDILNGVLAKQKSERDELAKKYRASVESFKQGALREQLVNLASRQKSLLLMAQKQKTLGQKIQNYKNTRQEPSGSAKEIQNILNSGETSNTKVGVSDGTVSCPGLVKDFEHRRTTESSFINQEPRQHPKRPCKRTERNGGTISQEVVGSQNMVQANKFRKDNTEEVPNSKSLEATEQIAVPSESDACLNQQSYLKETDYISQKSQGDTLLNAASRRSTSHNSEAESVEVNSSFNQPATESQKDILPNCRITPDTDLKVTEIFPHALSKSGIRQNTAQYSDCQSSEKQLKLKAKQSKKIQLLDLLKQGRLHPGDDVLEFMLQNSKHKASLLGNGKVKTDSSVYQNPVQWIKALLGNDISVSWKYIWNKVTYNGTLLSKIIGESIAAKEELLEQHKLNEKNSIEWDHSEGEDYCSSSHQSSSFQDADDMQQGVQIQLSTETHLEGFPSAAVELNSSYQPRFSTTSRRFLQFDKIMLIKDEEFLPCHIMEQYWNFYVCCENFGF